MWWQRYKTLAIFEVQVGEYLGEDNKAKEALRGQRMQPEGKTNSQRKARPFSCFRWCIRLLDTPYR